MNPRNPKKAKVITELLTQQINNDLKIIAMISSQVEIDPNVLHRVFIESHQELLKRKEAKK